MKPSPDWSRGVPLGQSVNGTIGLVVEGASEQVHLAWPYQSKGETRIRYVHLDATANPVVDRDLELPPNQLRTPRLLLARDGRLHLFWVSRPKSSEPWRLWYILLDREGHLAGQATRLSQADASVGDYAIAPIPSGGAVVVWDSGNSRELSILRLTPKGESDAGPVRVASTGQSPAVRVDAVGNIHLVWLEGTRVLYTHFAGGNLSLTERAEITNLKMGTGDSLAGPALGLSDGWVYVFWSILSRSGLEAGTASTEFVAFPPESPAFVPPVRMGIWPLEDQPYQDYEGGYPITELSQPAPTQFSSDFVYQPQTKQGQRETLIVTLAVSQQLRQGTEVQIAVGVFEAGQFKGYEMASKTSSLSGDAALAAGTAGHLHLAWREGAGGRAVYYATTAPEARAALNRLDIGDIVNALLQGSMEAFTGMLFFPLALAWWLPGLVLLGIWKLINDQENITDPVSRGILITAIVLYQGTKLLFLPTITFYVPFSAWIDVPKSWELPLQAGVPLLILGLAVFVAARVRRRRSSSTLLFFFSLILTDTLLTLAVYGVNFLGVF